MENGYLTADEYDYHRGEGFISAPVRSVAVTDLLVSCEHYTGAQILLILVLVATLPCPLFKFSPLLSAGASANIYMQGQRWST
jgi:hypothetical protein